MNWLALLLLNLNGASTAVAAAPEEIVVFGDGYERWDDTRWHVKTDMQLPLIMELGVDNGRFTTNGLQIDGVVHCDIDHRGKQRAEVFCLIEDISLRATMSAERQKRSADKAAAADHVTAILDQLDARLTNARLQLRVSPDGKVRGIDIEGLETSNRDQSLRNETITTLVQRLMLGFDMKLRKQHQLNEGSWKEYNNAMMSIPIPVDLKTTVGSSEMAHFLNLYKGKVLVQSIGRMQIGIPTAGLEARPDVEIAEDDRGGQTATAAIQQMLTGDFNGVSIFDPDTGYMLERVWTMSAEAVSNGLMSSAQQYHYQGKIAMLGEDDKPVLTRTGVVARPHLPVPDHLDPWVPVQER